MMKFCCFEDSGSRSEPKIGFRFAFGQFIDVCQAAVLDSNAEVCIGLRDLTDGAMSLVFGYNTTSGTA